MAQSTATQSAPEVANEAEQVRRALTRDAAAFRVIMQSHNRRLYRIARSILRNNADAEDAVQEAYVSAFTNLASYRGEATLASWLCRIVINESLGRMRQKRSTMDLALLEQRRGDAQIIPFPQSTPNDDPERTMAQRQIIELVEQATDNLPEPFRLVFVTRVIEGMSVEETSELLGHQTGDRQNSAAPGSSARARSVGKGDWAGADGCLSLRRAALRAHDRGRDETARISRLIE